MRHRMVGKVNFSHVALLILFLGIVDVIVIVAFWNTPVNVSNNDQASHYPSMATDEEGRIHVVWADDSINYPLNSEILYRSSSDGGATWGSGAALNLSASAKPSSRPVIAMADSNQRIITWIDGGDTVARIWGGSDWLPVVQLSATTTPTIQIAAAINEDGIALVAWNEGYGSVMGYDQAMIPDTRGFYRRWNGATWSESQPIAARLVTMRGSLAYIATDRATLLRSTNAGQSWGAPIPLPGDYQAPLDMKLDSSGTLHLAWSTANGVMFGRYDGRSFQRAVMIDSWAQPGLASANSAIRSVSVQGGELNTVLYCENRQNPAYYAYGRATTPS